jgi:hypothetical protein
MKTRNILFSFIISIVILAAFVSAAEFLGTDISRGAEMLIQIVKDIFGPFFQVFLGVQYADQYFFERFLMLVLLYVMIWTVLKRIELFKNNNFVCIIIASAVSILGARYMSEAGLIKGVLLPYGTLAVALSIFLPFLIYFFFVHYSIKSGVGRRTAWIVFAAIFLGLWLSRAQEIKEASSIYGFGIAAMVIAFIFDSRIQEYFGLFESRAQRRKVFNEQIAHLDVEIARYAAYNADSPEVRGVLVDLHKRRENLVKERSRGS